jgi:hypothetical protein
MKSGVYVVLWLLGVPLSVLVLVAIFAGCR